MNQPALRVVTTRQVAPGVTAFTANLPVPGLGQLPASAFLLRAREPVLIDAGVEALRDYFYVAISSEIDLADLRWVWLTHCDPDHVGCLYELLEDAPRARLVAPFLGLGKLGLRRPVPPERAQRIEPGQRLDLGDRQLLALRPPAYDAPETVAAFDTRGGTLFSSDCFGAVLPGPAAAAGEVSAATLREGVVAWGRVDAPWLTSIPRPAFDRATAGLRALDPARVLSSHLPPTQGRPLGELLGWLDGARRPDTARLRALKLGA